MTTLSRPLRPLTFASLFLLATAPLAFASGCFVVTESSTGTGGGGGDTSATTTSNSSSAGQGGSSVTGTTTSAGTGGVGTGGSSACVGPDGTGQTVASCDLMEITPSPKGPAASNCDDTGGTGGTNPPPGYRICILGFDTFTAGSAENLRECLGQINGAPATACDIAPVQACVDKMYNDACPSQLATDSCQLIKDMLCSGTEPFDLATCADQLKPFNATGMQLVADCITMSTDPVCQSAYDTCLADSLQP